MLSLLCYTKRMLALIQAHKGTTDLWQCKKGYEPAERSEKCFYLQIMCISAFICRFIQRKLFQELIISHDLVIFPFKTHCWLQMTETLKSSFLWKSS